MLFGKISALFVLGTAAVVNAGRVKADKQFTWNLRSVDQGKGVYGVSGTKFSECVYG